MESVWRYDAPWHYNIQNILRLAFLLCGFERRALAPSYIIPPNFGSPAYSYEDTRNWGSEYPLCNGLQQSPINIKISDVTKANFVPLEMRNHWELPKTMTLENDGHTVKLSGTWGAGREPTIAGGPLNHSHMFQEMHFHWGGDDIIGSEHTINGKRYSMEAHLVYWNTKYEDFNEAADSPNGLAVVTYLFKVANEENLGLYQFLTHLDEIPAANLKVAIDPLPISLVDVDPIKSFYTYEGSLTTPPCTENVSFIISRKRLPISHRQLEELRNTVEERTSIGDVVAGNFRSIQPLNGRKVFFAG